VVGADPDVTRNRDLLTHRAIRVGTKRERVELAQQLDLPDLVGRQMTGAHGQDGTWFNYRGRQRKRRLEQLPEDQADGSADEREQCHDRNHDDRDAAPARPAFGGDRRGPDRRWSRRRRRSEQPLAVVGARPHGDRPVHGRRGCHRNRPLDAGSGLGSQGRGQRVYERFACGPSRSGRFGEAPHDDRVDLLVELWVEGARPRWIRMHVGVQQLDHALTFERDQSREHLVGDGRQRVAIGCGPDLVAGHLLGRHVGRGAGRDAGQRRQRGALEQLRQAEVGQYQGLVLLEQHVGGLHIAVHDSLRVRVVEAGGDAAQESQCRAPRKKPVAQSAGEVSPWDVLNDHVRRPLVLAEIEDVEDVRMSHPRNRLRFVPESRDRVGVRRDGMHDLDCTGARELGVVGTVDSAHRTLANELQDLVLP